MPQCKICGKEVSNPEDFRHINSKYHQEALKKLGTNELKLPSNKFRRFKRKLYHKFKFLKFIRFKTLILILLILGIALTLLTIFIWFPSWHAGIRLNQQLYANKGGGMDYWEFFILNGWSSNFFFNKTALIGAILGSLIMTLPPVAKISVYKRSISTKRSVIFWWTLGFLIFYLFGNFIDANNAFSWGNYMIENEYLSYSGNAMTDTFHMLYNPNYMNFEALFIYLSVYLPIINFILIVFIVKMVFLIKQCKENENTYYFAACIIIILGLFLGLGYFNAPYFALNGIALIQLYSLLFGFYGCIIFGVLIAIFGKLDNGRSLKRTKFSSLLALFVLIFLILTPLFISIGPAMNLGDSTIWTEEEWNKRVNREIKWTTICAGLDMFEERPIEELYTATISDDDQIIPLIRQYDMSYAIPYMAAKMSSTYEALADADIVYINGREYWIAPKTLNTYQIKNDPIQTSTELYDHVEGILAMDTFTGELVDLEDIINISTNYPIYFGEVGGKWSEDGYWVDDSESKAFKHDILLGTEWAGGIDKNKHVYEGAPDGTLKGLEAAWYTVNLGLWGYAWDGEEKSFLINRNIEKRVESILLPHLKMDFDPYIVFNIDAQKMYYATCIYTEIPIYMYSRTPIYRLIGFCLVDVETGELEWYKNPALKTNKDPTYSLWKIYLDKYPWEDTPEWLKNQLRYPEGLFERQLDAYYKYHVSSPKSWKRGDDFHERPDGGDLFYVEMDIGEGLEYVGIDLVEYMGKEARTLAGMYVLRHGDHFGEAIFYHTKNSTESLIGPKTARDTYDSEATQQISLISNNRHGNTLLYPLAGTLYYYVPTYSQSGGLEQLKLAGFVEAFNSEVGYGSDAWDAYYTLDIPRPPSNFTLTSDADTPKDTDGAFNLTWTSSTFADKYSIYVSNQTITKINENVTLIVEDLTSLIYPIIGLSNDTYYYKVFGFNDYGNSTSNELMITVEIPPPPPPPPPISYEFTFEEFMIIPNDLAAFSISIYNYDTNVTAPGINVKLNLTVYSTHFDANYSLIVAPSNLPLSNATFTNVTHSGITFEMFNETLLFGEGILYGGFLNCTEGNIIVYYTWELIIDDGKAIYMEYGTIIVYL